MHGKGIFYMAKRNLCPRIVIFAERYMCVPAAGRGSAGQKGCPAQMRGGDATCAVILMFHLYGYL